MRRHTKSQAEGKERTEQFQPRCTGKCAGLVGFRLPYGHMAGLKWECNDEP